MENSFSIDKCQKDASGHLLCQTRDGRKARIIATDRKGYQPIVALVEFAGKELVKFYDPSGWFHSDQSESPRDLVNIPEPKKWRAWRHWSEVPDLQGLIRLKGLEGFATRILGFSPKGLDVSSGNYSPVLKQKPWEVLFEDDEYSSDGGKTWLPCGVEE